MEDNLKEKIPEQKIIYLDGYDEPVIVAKFCESTTFKENLIHFVVNTTCSGNSSCEVTALDPSTGENRILIATHSSDGDGYVNVTCYDENRNYIDSCKLKHPTDTYLPYNFNVTSEPDCSCSD